MRAILLGLVIQLASAAWLPLLILNASNRPEWPWATAAMVFILSLFWLYASGRGPPTSNAAFRRSAHRATALAPASYTFGLLAAIVGIGGVTALGIALSLLLHPETPDLSQLSVFPSYSLVVIFFGWALTAGVIEETAFRGYMQSMIEQKHGALAAILVTSVVFTLVHFSTSIALLPVIFLASVIYGLVAWRTGSIIPGMIAHVAGNFLEFIWAWFGANVHLSSLVTPQELLGGAAGAFVIFFVLLFSLRRRGGR